MASTALTADPKWSSTEFYQQICKASSLSGVQLWNVHTNNIETKVLPKPSSKYFCDRRFLFFGGVAAAHPGKDVRKRVGFSNWTKDRRDPVDIKNVEADMWSGQKPSSIYHDLSLGDVRDTFFKDVSVPTGKEGADLIYFTWAPISVAAADDVLGLRAGHASLVFTNTYSTSFLHVEDGYLGEINYLHQGSPKVNLPDDYIRTRFFRISR